MDIKMDSIKVPIFAIVDGELNTVNNMKLNHIVTDINANIRSIGHRDDGKYFAIATDNNIVLFFDTGKEEIVKLIESDDMIDFAYFVGKSSFYVIETKHKVEIWDTDRNALVKAVRKTDTSPFKFYFKISDDGKFFLIQTSDDIIELWSLIDVKRLSKIKTKYKIEYFSFVSKNEGSGSPIRFFYIFGEDDYIRIWDLEKKRPIAKFSCKYWPYVFSINQEHLVLVDHGIVMLYNLNDNQIKRLKYLNENNKSILSKLQLSSCGRYMLLVHGPIVILLDLKDFKVAKTFKDANILGTPAAALSSDGKYLLIGIRDNMFEFSTKIRLYDIEKKREIKSFEGLLGYDRCCFSQDNKFLAVLTLADMVSVYDIESGKKVSTFVAEKLAHHDVLMDISIPYSNLLLAISDASKIFLWNIIEEKPLGVFYEKSKIKKADISDDFDFIKIDIGDKSKFFQLSKGAFLEKIPKNVKFNKANFDKSVRFYNAENFVILELLDISNPSLAIKNFLKNLKENVNAWIPYTKGCYGPLRYASEENIRYFNNLLEKLDLA
ncbi:MAG: hypothetical protein ACTSYD_14415 [Candidatus Heimdallarchaeaceae archaeon]